MLVHSRSSFQKFSEHPKSAADHLKSFIFVSFHLHTLTRAGVFLKSTQSPILTWKIVHSWFKAVAVHQYCHSKFHVICHARIQPSKKLKLVKTFYHSRWLLRRSISKWRQCSIRRHKTKNASIFITNKKFDQINLLWL